MKTIQYLLLAGLLMPHFCVAYEVSDRGFVVVEKALTEKVESILPNGMKLRTGAITLLMRMLGIKGTSLQLTNDDIIQRQNILTANVLHSFRASLSEPFALRSINIECVRNL